MSEEKKVIELNDEELEKVNGGMNATVMQEKVRAAEASTEAVSATDQYAKLEAEQEATKRIAAEMQQFAEVSSGQVNLA